VRSSACEVRSSAHELRSSAWEGVREWAGELLVEKPNAARITLPRPREWEREWRLCRWEIISALRLETLRVRRAGEEVGETGSMPKSEGKKELDEEGRDDGSHPTQEAAGTVAEDAPSAATGTRPGTSGGLAAVTCELESAARAL